MRSRWIVAFVLPSFVALVVGCGDSDVESGKESGQGTKPKTRVEQLKQIGIAMHVLATEPGQRFLPEDFDPTESNWREVVLERTRDSADQGPALFTKPDDEGKTRYLLVTGPGTMFDFEAGRVATMTEVEKSWRPSMRIPLVIVVGSDAAVPWDEPGDYVLDPDKPREGLGETGEVIAYLAADGSIQRIPGDIEDELLVAFLQARNDLPPDLKDRYEEVFPLEYAEPENVLPD